MSVPNFFFNLFINRAGRLRSGWRFASFAVAFLVALLAISKALLTALALALPGSGNEQLLAGNWGFILQDVLALLLPAVLVGWACGRVLEDLPWRALGWTPHRGWARHLGAGLLVGALLICATAGVAALFGHLRFTLTPVAAWAGVGRTLVVSASVLLFGAAAEESLFRGYPLQTLMRSWPHWLALVPTSLLFALGHLSNPHVAPVFTMLNTLLAGVWLAVAYLRTRSMWFPLGLHWSWNWTMGALLGIPVSGIESLAPEPLLRATEDGPAWLTGGAYGLEGGAACTLVLLCAILLLWRVRLVAPDPELKRLTDAENPQPPLVPVYTRDAPEMELAGEDARDAQ